MSQDDLQALTEWPNWAAATCASTSSQSSGSCSCPGGSSTLSGSDNQQKVFNYFVGKGLSPSAAAGIDGNFGQESGWNPAEPGGLIAQWGGARLAAEQALAQKEGKPSTDLGVELDYVWLELTGGPGAAENDNAVLQQLKQLQSSSDNAAAQAAGIFMGPPAASPGYERPLVGPTEHLDNRIKYALEILHTYGGSTAGENSGDCSGTVSCSSSSNSTTGLSPTRQNVVCMAQKELALWKSQPGYGNPYPNFKYAQTGYLKYTQNRQEEWCADFASWVYNQAGDPLQQSDWNVPSVASIQSIGEQNSHFHWHPQSSGYTPKPGDLAIHGTGHVNIYISSRGSTAQYIGGDQGSGPYPGGSIVSIETGSGYYDNGITGYVSPD